MAENSFANLLKTYEARQHAERDNHHLAAETITTMAASSQSTNTGSASTISESTLGDGMHGTPLSSIIDGNEQVSSPLPPSTQKQTQGATGPFEVRITPFSSALHQAGSSAPSASSATAVQTDSTGGTYTDITDYLNLPQTEAAKKLGIPTSTLSERFMCSKRWKEAVVGRKWPHRTVAKLDKEIMTLLHNIPQGADAPPLPPEIEQSLGILLRKRQDELRPVTIRL